MFIKVCGMRDSANIKAVVAMKPDYMGFIFYPKSKRYVGTSFDKKLLPSDIKSVAVFVDEAFEDVTRIVSDYGFEVVQLHGSESPEYCKLLKCSGVTVFKAFGIGDGFDWAKLQAYVNVCDYFLFDTSCAGHGGSGQKFSWELLRNYNIDKPFILSGGIGPEDAESIKSISHRWLAGIDINSRFEIEPALKNIAQLDDFLKRIK